MNRKLQANYLFTSDGKPIKNGILVVQESGKILEIAAENTYTDVEQYEGVICAGFVNAHCHLELSHLKGYLPQHTGLVDFLKPINQLRTQFDEATILAHIDKAAQEMTQNGIVAVGDICNSTNTLEKKVNSKIKYHNFIEIFGLNPTRANPSLHIGDSIYKKFIANVNHHTTSISPHAPYTASGELLEGIQAFNQKNSATPLLSIHNQESAAENELFQQGTGDFVSLYKDNPYIASLDTFFEPTETDSMDYTLKYLTNNAKILMVHNTFSQQRDIEKARQHPADIWWCFCPNANLYIENRLPNFELFMQYQNDKIVVGTDSLASNHQLCILSEIKAIQSVMPKISLNMLLKWATINGANFFNWQENLGSLTVGKTPGVNLIKNIDLQNLVLKNNSTIQKLF